MSNLITRQVNFHGDNLMAAKDKNTGKIYTGVSYICRGIGLTKDQKDRQVKNVQSDLVLNKGCVKFGAGVFDLNNTTLAMDIDFLPLWLAKISITPKMQEEQPEVVEKLIQYQLNAKDVLADAFLNKTEQYNLPSTYSEALRQLADKVEENEKQKVIIQEQKPKVLFAESVQASTTTILIGQLAKILKQNGIDMGQNRLFEWLRKNGYLISRKGTDYNIPTQKSMDLGLFTIKETSIGHSDGHVSISTTPKVTGKGQVYFVNKFKELQEGVRERQATK